MDGQPKKVGLRKSRSTSKGTYSRALGEPSGNTSIPIMVKLLGDGLCADQGEGDIEISDGVYYKHTELQHLHYYYDLSYMFGPKSIDMVLGETEVRIDGRIYVGKRPPA